MLPVNPCCIMFVLHRLHHAQRVQTDVTFLLRKDHVAHLKAASATANTGKPGDTGSSGTSSSGSTTPELGALRVSGKVNASAFPISRNIAFVEVL